MKKILLLLASLSVLSANCQDYYFNQLSLNPAFAGAKGGFSAMGMLGKQFNNTGTGGIGSIGGITSGGTSIGQLFSADGLIAGGRGGFGFQAVNSRLGYSNNTQVYASTAYRIEGEDGNLISVGLQGGFTYLPIFDVATNSNINKVIPQAGLGGLIILENLFLSISKPVLLQKDNEIVNPTKPFWLYAGYAYPTNDELSINGAVLLGKVAGVTPRLDFSLRGWYKEKYSVGALARFGDARNLIAFGEVQLGKFRFGGAYDSKPYGSSQQGFQRGIFQFMLRYEGIGENPTIMRYF